MRKLKTKVTVPTVTKSSEQRDATFPVDHYSASSMIAFTTNPVLFRIRYINRETIDTTNSAKSVIGKAFHRAVEVYYGGGEGATAMDESEAIAQGLKAGVEYIDQYQDGWIKWTDSIPNKQKMQEMVAFGFNAFVTEHKYEPNRVLATEDEIKESVSVEYDGQMKHMPVPLKGKIDRVDEVNGDIEVRDYKTVHAFSDPDKIDGAKMIQAVAYFLLVHAKYGRAPKRMYYDEVKLTKNRDGGPQTRSYCVEYSESGLFFHFFFRLYEDITRALAGEAVFVPNINALYDNEVSLVAYMHGLDLPEKLAELKKKHRTEDITEVLTRELNSKANERKFLEAIQKNTTLAKGINYETMKIEEKIQTKLMEHGIVVRFDSVVSGATVDLYRYAPSIGVKMSKLRNYTDDIEQVLGKAGVRVLAPIQNSTLIGYEVPKAERRFPALPKTDGHNMAIGERSDGTIHRYDLRTAPHLLVAGASGSGKSVFLGNIIKQVAETGDSELWLIDPKKVELAGYRGQATRYATDIDDIRDLFADLTTEMHRRYELLHAKGAKKLDDLKGKNKPKYIYAIVDEFGDLITGKHTRKETTPTGEIYAVGELKGQPKYKVTTRDISSEIEAFLLGLAQMARASGIHIVIATQRPSTDVVKGTIKANFPAKAVFRTAKAVDSQVVIDEAGAEKLLGKGDMLWSADGATERLQAYA